MQEEQFRNHSKKPHFINFWQKGLGKELLFWSGAKPSLSRLDELSAYYYKVDELADEVVKETYLKYPYPEATKIIEKHKDNNSDLSKEEKLESLIRLLGELEHTPLWLDPSLALEGTKLCRRAGVTSLMILRDFSLMGGYDFAFLNKPLIYTGALRKGAVKRLKDTLEFWVQATRPGGLEKGAEGLDLILRTRLMHAYSRLEIKRNLPDWNLPLWGEPINFFDMSATYLGFSLVYLYGLERMGIRPTEKEEAGLFHLWRHIGFLLGIPSKLLPDNKKQATELFYHWTALQAPGDQDSRSLAESLLDENLESPMASNPTQAKILYNLHLSVSNALIDSDVRKRLSLEKVPFYGFFPYLVKFKNFSEQKLSQFQGQKGREKLIDRGGKEQLKVLEDYLAFRPKI